MNAIDDCSSEQWRRICKARSWLRQGDVTVRQVQALRRRIAGIRGDGVADALLEEMRWLWKMHRSWMQETPS
ncbi:MAG TPA: DUF7696 family protein [Xylella sp.]